MVQVMVAGLVQPNVRLAAKQEGPVWIVVL